MMSVHRPSSRTSCSVNTAVPPASEICLATSAPAAALTSVSSTAAPCAANKRDVSAPIPEAAPVTIATLPTSLFPGCIDHLASKCKSQSRLAIVMPDPSSGPSCAISALEMLDGQPADLLARDDELHDLCGAVAYLQPHDVAQALLVR